jgi:hypothetical protein
MFPIAKIDFLRPDCSKRFTQWPGPRLQLPKYAVGKLLRPLVSQAGLIADYFLLPAERGNTHAWHRVKLETTPFIYP